MQGTDANGSRLARFVHDRDLYEPTTLEESDALWHELRELGPVVWTEREGGYWAVTRYDQVCEAFRNWEAFSSARADPDVSATSFHQARIPLLVPEELDPPLWHAYRRVLAELLSPGASEALRPSVRRWCVHFLDQVIETGRGDLVRDLAVPVPVSVTMEWLGFPKDEWFPIATTFHDVSAYPPGHPTREAGLARYGEILEGIRREIEVRRAEPRDDALAWIVGAEIDGAPMDQRLLEGIVFLSIAGGVDTTTSLTSAALAHLGTHLDDRAALIADPSSLKVATEEFLRVYPPARAHARRVAEDTEVLGCPMHAGDRLLISEASANFDERQFPDPQRFDREREPNRHVSFGMGLHRCPGSHLARIMFTEMVTAVLERMPDYELEGSPVQYPAWTTLGGWARIPVRFTPGPRIG